MVIESLTYPSPGWMTGTDVIKIAELLGLDPRISPKFLRAGIGWGLPFLF